MNQEQPRSWRLRCWGFLLCLVTAQVLAAADGIPELTVFDYSLDQITPDFRGMGTTTDRNGMIYFASASGIVRFDGSRWRKISQESAHSLISNLAGDIYAIDSRRKIIFRFSTDSPMVTEVVQLGDQLIAAGLPENRVGDFRDYSRVGSDVYLTQTWSVARLRRNPDGSHDVRVFRKPDVLPSNLKFRRIFEVRGKPMIQIESTSNKEETYFGWLREDGTVEMLDDFKIDHHIVSCAVLDADSEELEIYAAGMANLFRLRPGSVETVTPDFVKSMPQGRIINLIPLNDGGAAAEVRPDGIIVLDKNCEVWANLPLVSSSSFTHCTVDSLNRIWVAVQNRVARFNTDSGNRSFSLPHESPLNALASTDDYLLMASGTHVYYAKTTPDRIHPIEKIIPIPGVESTGRTSIVTMGTEVFVLSQIGVYYWDSTTPTRDAVLLVNTRASNLVPLDSNRLVLGSIHNEQPFLELTGGVGNWKVGKHLPTGRYKSAQIFLDSQGDVWSAQSQSAAGERALRLKADGTVATYDFSGLMFEFENKIYALRDDLTVVQFDRDKEKFFPDAEFREMLEADIGEAFQNVVFLRVSASGLRICNSHSALWRVERVNGRLRAFRLPQQTSIFETKDAYGRLWRTVSDRLIVDSDRATAGAFEDFSVLFTDVALSNSGEVASDSADQAKLPGSSNARQPLLLSHSIQSQDSIEFNVCAETLNIEVGVPLAEKPENALLSVRMLGIGDHWSEPSYKNQFQYPALPGGKYVFEAKALLPSGNWSKLSQLKITVHPKLHQTLAFKAFATTSVLGLVAAVSFYAVRKERVRVNTLSEVVRKQEETERQLIDSQEELVRRERLQAFGTLAAGITHDINNLLTPILSYASILSESGEQDAEVTRDFSHIIATCATDAAEIIARLTPIYRPRLSSNQPCAMNSIVEDVAELLRTKIDSTDNKDVQVVVQAAPATVQGVPSELREVLINLGNNAIDAIDSKGTIWLRCMDRDSDVIVEVEDDGVGMSDDLLSRCTESFFSSKGEYGTGLGLATSTVIVSSYGGTLKITSSPGAGTVICLSFPSEAHVPVTLDEEKQPPKDEGRLTILLVDDIDPTRKAIKTLLESFSHSVTDFSRAHQAVHHLESHSNYDLIITDHQMPEMEGSEFCQLVGQKYPKINTILMSGYEPFGAHECCDLFLRKPVSSSALRQLLLEVREHKSQRSDQLIRGPEDKSVDSRLANSHRLTTTD